jgi:hypothetical protein
LGFCSFFHVWHWNSHLLLIQEKLAWFWYKAVFLQALSIDWGASVP